MKLIIVPTPIGNLEDITLRAIRVLKECDLVIAEDTRVSQKLLHHLGLQKKLESFHAANEHKKLDHVLSLIEQHEMVALVSDAGTPAISDPGFLLVRACIQKDIPVECLPGPTALIPALVNSGFPCDTFVFEGFLPHKKGRVTKMSQWVNESRTVIFYESPHRIEKCVEQMLEVLGEEREICICRELTKMHEEIIRGTIGEIHSRMSEHTWKGEMVVVLKGME